MLCTINVWIKKKHEKRRICNRTLRRPRRITIHRTYQKTWNQEIGQFSEVHKEISNTRRRVAHSRSIFHEANQSLHDEFFGLVAHNYFLCVNFKDITFHCIYFHVLLIKISTHNIYIINIAQQFVTAPLLVGCVVWSLLSSSSSILAVFI